MEKNSLEERVFIIAPVGQDAHVMAELLARRRFETQICDSLKECCAQIKSGAGAFVLTEEALELGSSSEFFETLGAQPPWSELPLIILTSGGEFRSARLLELVTEAAGSVTLLERPIETTTLIRSLEVALNSRLRQYQVRDLLEEQRRNEHELRQAHEQLADRAKQLQTLVESRTAKLAEANEQLRREMAEREALRRKLLHAQEEERRRIARELHDQMGQNLTALNVGLKSLLRRTEDQVQAIIEDDGRGFDARVAAQSGNGSGRLGLLGIQERLGMVGGNFKVESAPERGTTLLVRIPIPKAHEKEKNSN